MTYQLTAGRTIERDGHQLARVTRIGDDHMGYTVRPSEADDLAREIVVALNRPRFLFQEWHAENDANGNPRRVTVVYGPQGDTVAALDHGYSGAKIPEGAVSLMTASCSGVTWRDLVRGEEVREVARRYLDRVHPTGVDYIGREALKREGLAKEFRARLRSCRAEAWMLKTGNLGLGWVATTIWAVEAQRKAGHAYPADADGKAVWR